MIDVQYCKYRMNDEIPFSQLTETVHCIHLLNPSNDCNEFDCPITKREPIAKLKEGC